MRDRALSLFVTVSVFSTSLLWGASASAQTTEREATEISEIAEALIEDPVYVDDHMAQALGEDVVEEIRSHVEGGPNAVYVVLAEVESGTSSAPGLIADETGIDGAYYYMGHGSGVAGAEGNSQESIRLASWQAEQEGVELSRPELLTESVRLIQQDTFVEEYDAMVAAMVRGDDEEGVGFPMTGGRGLALGGLIGTVLLGLVGAVRAKVRKRQGKQQVVSPEGSM
ncbi:hypothetical protein GCM10007079_48570 [Nocardiopsis terrae]|uniref:TPM domain-containing protein n=1 Tax=Nocardiopsis terrae TaxID=372655 RepID=A0ABR9HAU1_9ACTN|nr:hypothetical protein [Nocardiopsis terrae]MBE1456026.1 hypothetical protein [Nocardiopsis terrae]GHC96229.1 hypothetical protein GCM10007079_48570 [Nocardiopsis terrae]